MHFINDFTYITNLKPPYDLFYLSIKYSTFKITEYVVSELLDNLGRHASNCEKFEDLFINNSTKELTVDGHAIKSPSHDYTLTEEGNKSHLFKDKQMNLSMAYDINASNPVLSRIYAGATMDNISFSDLFERKKFIDTLLIINRSFYSVENI